MDKADEKSNSKIWDKLDAVIKDAKKRGLHVSCSVAAHHLFLTDDELESFDSRAKVTPPLRTESDRKALIKGLKDGTIDMITSDHHPIDIENKKLEFSLAENGTIGLESFFGAVNSVVDLETLINAITVNPKAIFGIKGTSICENQDANLTLFDPKTSYSFSERSILSTSKNSAFLDKTLKGKVYGIIVNKKSVLNHG